MATLLAAGSSRRVGVITTLAWVVLAGLLIGAPIAALSGAADVGGDDLAWLAVVGIGNAAGLALIYAGYRRARVAVVACLASTQGALAALIAVAAGERPSPLTLLGFLPVVVGVVLVAFADEEIDPAARASTGTAIALGMTAAALFAVSLFAAGKAGEGLPAAWVALPARVVGVTVLVVVLAAGMRPLIAPGRARLAIAAGAAEVVGIIAFTIGARESVAVTAVLGSQFAALTAVGGLLLFGERLRPRQVTGVAILAVGVAMVALGTAG